KEAQVATKEVQENKTDVEAKLKLETDDLYIKIKPASDGQQFDETDARIDARIVVSNAARDYAADGQ
ncbi:hypothetical protein LCGC14_1064230, partial [marine sediment metagenome]